VRPAGRTDLGVQVPCGLCRENRYPPVLFRLPSDVATTVCQRINFRWDEKLRRRYLVFLAVITATFFVVVFSLGLSLDQTLRSLIMGTLLPLFPRLKFLLEQISENRATAGRLGSLAEHSNTRLEAMLKGDNPQTTARNIQDFQIQHCL